MTDVMDVDHPDHHVHFSEGEDTFPEDDHDKIVFKSKGKGQVTVHLGFLKHLHRYEINFNLPRNCCEGLLTNGDSARLTGDLTQQNLPNIACHLQTAFDEGEKGIKVVLAFFAHKDKLLRETMVVVDESSGAKLNIEFTARVLGEFNFRSELFGLVGYILDIFISCSHYLLHVSVF